MSKLGNATRGVCLFAATAIGCLGPLSAQTAKNVSAADLTYSTWDLGLFGGGQWFQLYQGDTGGIQRFAAGGLWGARFDYDFWKYIGGEASFSYGTNNLLLNPAQTSNWVGVGVRDYQATLNPMFYFTDRTTRFRPFLTAGPSFVAFDTMGNRVVTPQYPQGQQIPSKNGPGLMYGGGVKYNVTPRIGLRLDLRGLYAKKQFFGLPQTSIGPGSIYIPGGHNFSALQATLGITFRFGLKSETAAAPVVVAPSKPVAPVTPVAPLAPPVEPVKPPAAPQIQVGAIQGAHDVCPGDSLPLRVTANGVPAGQTVQYQWLIDSQPVAGVSGASVNLPIPNTPGNRSVAVRVSAGGASAISDPVSLLIRDYRPPTIQFTEPSTMNYGDRLPLNATATSSPCSGNTTITYTASQGTITGNTFDPSSVTFDTSRPGLQTVTVRLTATARDQRNGTATATADVTITRKPEAKRLEDIVYPSGSSRVNNCAKRVLLEELSPMLREDPNAKVILVGHRDTNESGANLDRSRVYNGAAVLSAGTGICSQVELNRIQGTWVGTDQSTPTNPSFCGTSTNVKERSGQGVTNADDRAQYRRVELWFVPSGSDMPVGAAGARDLPTGAVKALGCPR